MDIGQYRPPAPTTLATPMTPPMQALLDAMVAGLRVEHRREGLHYVYVRLDTFANVSRTVIALKRRGMVTVAHSDVPATTQVRHTDKGRAYATKPPALATSPH